MWKLTAVKINRFTVSSDDNTFIFQGPSTAFQLVKQYFSLIFLVCVHVCVFGLMASKMFFAPESSESGK